MSFKIDDEVWEPQSTTEHANAMMESINNYMKENDVKDSEGNIIQLSANFANALYLLCLASGSRLSENDEKLSQAINSLNVALCDDQQILNLLPIAGISRNQGSYSTLVLTCTASEDGSCTIPAGTKAPYKNFNFVTQNDIVISAGETAEIKTKCDTVGAVTVLSGEVKSFSGTIANLKSVENLESSVPGKEAETTNELRNRILRGDTVKYSLEGCGSALRELTGISQAKIYFNYNIDADIELTGGVILKPRRAYIVIHGDSDEIAEVYSNYCSAQTQNGNDTETARRQDFVTESGQIIPIYYNVAKEQTVFVRIVLAEDSDYNTQVENQLKSDLITSSSSWGIGNAVTSLLTSVPFKDCTYAKVAYTQVSLDGSEWLNMVEVGSNILPRLNESDITVEQL